MSKKLIFGIWENRKMKIDKMIFTRKMPYSAECLANLYKDTASGHFFDADTMKFFRSRITGDFKRINDSVCLFITTERGPNENSKRFATIRRATITNEKCTDGFYRSKVEIETVDEFNSLTLRTAQKRMREMTK